MTGILDYVGLAFRAVQHKDEIQYLVDKISPYVNELKREWPDVYPRVERLLAELFPEMEQSVADNLGVASFDVKWVQETLNQLNSTLKLHVDSDYGPATQTAVKQFQVAHNLVPDGWVGPNTFRELFLELNNKKVKL